MLANFPGRPTHHSIQCVQKALQRPDHEVVHKAVYSCPLNEEVKHAWSYTSTFHIPLQNAA